MDYVFFLKPLLFSMAITLATSLIFIRWGGFFSAASKRSGERHIHKKGTVRFGGVAMVIAFISSLFLDGRLVITPQLWGVIIACALIIIIGLVDDLIELSWKKQIILQIFIVAIVFVFGVRLTYITNPLGGIISFSGQWGYYLGFILAALWVIFLMNALNWVDGIDGLSGGITAIGAATIFFLSMRADVNQPPVAIIATIVFGIMLAFLILNFYPAKIIAGTSGSMFMGFILAVLGIFAGAKIATTALVMTLPLIDACWVIFERIKAGKSVFLPDKRHLHYRLMLLGWSQRKISLVCYAITAIVAYVALNFDTKTKAAVFIILAVSMLIMLTILKRKTMAYEK